MSWPDEPPIWDKTDKKRGEQEKEKERERKGRGRREAQDAKKRHKTAATDPTARPFNIPARASTRSAGLDASCLGYPARNSTFRKFRDSLPPLSFAHQRIPVVRVSLSRNFATRDLQPDRLPDRCDDTSDFVNLYESWITRRNNGAVG